MKQKNYWEYRIVSETINGVKYFGITEVYFKDGKPSSYVEPKDYKLGMFEDFQDIKWVIDKYKKALKKPIVEVVFDKDDSILNEKPKYTFKEYTLP